MPREQTVTDEWRHCGDFIGLCAQRRTQKQQHEAAQGGAHAEAAARGGTGRTRQHYTAQAEQTQQTFVLGALSAASISGGRSGSPRRTAAMRTVTADGLADDAALMKQIANARRVVSVVGAGLSTSSGIPDFRSSGGLYDQVKAKYNLRSGTDLFDANLFRV